MRRRAAPDREMVHRAHQHAGLAQRGGVLAGAPNAVAAASFMDYVYDPANAALYRWSRGRLDRVAGDVTVSNGLAWSPDGRTLYWSDTSSHRVFAFDFDGTMTVRDSYTAFLKWRTPPMAWVPRM